MTESLPLNALPLFPLGAVLYPGGFLPLRIFEVRYLDMIGKCHKSGAPFGVVALTEGVEVRRPASPKAGSAGSGSGASAAPPSGDGFAIEAFNDVGTLAMIDELTVPQPGLMVIRCRGEQRFTVRRSEKLKHGLWVADVARLPADQAIVVPPDLKHVADALGRLIATLKDKGLAADELPVQPPYQLEDCGWVANRWCELLSLPIETRQRMMVLDNPLLRLELVGDILERSGIAN